MDPVVFGVQISTLLDRIAAERAASGTVPRRHQPAVAVVDEEDPEPIEAEPAVEPPPPAKEPGSTSSNDWSELLAAMRREIEVAQSIGQPQADEAESQPLNLDEFARIIDDANEPPVRPDKKEAREPETPEPAPAPVAASAPARKKKVRHVPPQDEFGFFDPQQCGLSALFAKLDTINPPGKTGTPKKPA